MGSCDGLCCNALASMPGGDLLFHRLSDSTIGAVGFHVRVRDGIGWDTDAMATRQWSRRAVGRRACWRAVLLSIMGIKSMHLAWGEITLVPTLMLGVCALKRE